jgi:hemin uptake protein HemP
MAIAKIAVTHHGQAITKRKSKISKIILFNI